ncbi:MAG: hypothetical protein J0H94_20785 [Rhizobiales bacterium]|nr:hypothetical protein [Hyphomicrobiales bacterium]
MASGCSLWPMLAVGRISRLVQVLALLLFGLVSAAQAERYIRELPPAGGRGDYAFNDVCKDGFLIGFKARTGAWVDQIQMICSAYVPGQPWKPRLTDSYGGNGGTPDKTNEVCPTGAVLSGITLKFTKDFRQVFGIYGRCRDIATGKNSPAFVILPFDQQQAETESATKNYTCGSNEAAAGISGRYGKHVNAIGLNCGRFPPEDAAPPPQAAAPPKPIHHTGQGAAAGPASPPGVLVCHTGVAMQPIGAPQADGGLLVSFAAAPQPADQALPDMGQCAWDTQTISPNQAKRLALRASVMAKLGDIHIDRIFRLHATAMNAFLFSTGDVEILVDNAPPAGGGGQPVNPAKGAGLAAQAQANFAGEWKAVADGVSYDITIAKQGSAMVGTFTGADGSSGQLSGAPRGNVLRFSWSQADGSRGTGRFVLSANGRSFTGSYNFGGNPDVAEGSWNGTRVAQ